MLILSEELLNPAQPFYKCQHPHRRRWLAVRRKGGTISGGTNDDVSRRLVS